MMKRNLIREKTFNFSLESFKLQRYLRHKRQYEVAAQFIRSATSVGANVEEAIAAQSKKDFIHKMNVSLKEARETLYWLKLFNHAGLLPKQLQFLLKDIVSIIKILTKIITTSPNNQTK